MKIIAGLGNPGDQYRTTRHNMGFLVLDALADDAEITSLKKKFEALIGDGRLGGHRVLLVKPDWVFLDESTSALDEAAEQVLYRGLKQCCPATTVVSVGHRSTLRALHDRVWSIGVQGDAELIRQAQSRGAARADEVSEAGRAA